MSVNKIREYMKWTEKGFHDEPPTWRSNTYIYVYMNIVCEE